MNKRQVNLKEMYDSVNLYFDSNAAKWSPIPKLAELINQFSGLTAAIEAAESQQSEAKTYLGKNKTQLKKLVAEKADILNDSLEAMALINGDEKLALRMSESYSSLFKMRNLDFIGRVNEVIVTADQYAEELITSYGVTAEQIAGMKADADQFSVMNGLPRAYQVASISATKDLETLFEQTSELLKNGLDKMMAIFKRRDPNFYNGYQAARTVVDN